MKTYITVKIESRKDEKEVLRVFDQHLDQMKDGNVITTFEIVDIGDTLAGESDADQ